jgi:hypothetical protein
MDLMNYSEARSQIRSGDLLAWTHRSWGSWYDFKVQMVRAFTRSEFSHVGIAWVSGGRVWVIESVTPLVRIVPLSNLLPCYHVTVAAQWSPECEQFALSFVGNERYRYSQWEAVKALFGCNDRTNTRLECAEFAHKVLGQARVSLYCDDTPSELVAAAMRERGTVQTYLEVG